MTPFPRLPAPPTAAERREREAALLVADFADRARWDAQTLRDLAAMAVARETEPFWRRALSGKCPTQSRYLAAAVYRLFEPETPCGAGRKAS